MELVFHAARREARRVPLVARNSRKIGTGTARAAGRREVDNFELRQVLVQIIMFIGIRFCTNDVIRLPGLVVYPLPRLLVGRPLRPVRRGPERGPCRPGRPGSQFEQDFELRIRKIRTWFFTLHSDTES